MPDAAGREQPIRASPNGRSTANLAREPKAPATRTGGRLSAVQRLQAAAGNHAVAQLLSTNVVQRKGEGTGGGTAGGTVGMPGGESKTASDQDNLAPGYKSRPDGNVDTPDGRSVPENQARDESKVVNSESIYMAAYLARYNDVKSKYGLAQPAMNRLSQAAGFLKQFKTGDVVLRQMDASDSQGLAKITNSQYSHSGIVKADGGQCMVLDSYPHGFGKDATILSTFEDFFSDQHGEHIVNAVVVRAHDMTDETRAAISALIDKYDVEATSFDYDFKIDNAPSIMYCSELVTRILTEAKAKNLPENEFEATKNNVIRLIGALEAMIEFQKKAGSPTADAEKQLATLKALLQNQTSSSGKALFSPGSFERNAGFDTLTGFSREGAISGTFKVTVLDATVPKMKWETPDPYVVLGGGLSGRTKTKDDTESPSWGESFGGFSYDSLGKATFQVRDEDVVYDDDIATLSGDVRPVRPAGQTFTMNDGGTTLRVKSEAESKDASTAGQAPRAAEPL